MRAIFEPARAGAVAWRFIKEYHTRPSPLHLGFGQDDRFARSHRLMAAALHGANVNSAVA
jgi:hypothetical protein